MWCMPRTLLCRRLGVQLRVGERFMVRPTSRHPTTWSLKQSRSMWLGCSLVHCCMQEGYKLNLKGKRMKEQNTFQFNFFMTLLHSRARMNMFDRSRNFWTTGIFSSKLQPLQTLLLANLKRFRLSTYVTIMECRALWTVKGFLSHIENQSYIVHDT